MKFKFQAGAEMDLITPGEMREELDRARLSWVDEVSRGVRYRRFSFVADVNGGGLVQAGFTGDPIGPDTGMVWKLHRLSVVGGYDPTTQALALYFNDSGGGSSVIVPKLATYTVDMGEVLSAGDRLCVGGTGPANTRLWITGQVKEAPASLMWRL